MAVKTVVVDIDETTNQSMYWYCLHCLVYCCQRAESSVSRAQQLNPMVDVRVDSGSVADKPASFFASYDVVCATCCTLAQLIRVDDICRQHNVAFFAGDVFGYFGFMFADLHQHEYAE